MGSRRFPSSSNVQQISTTPPRVVPGVFGVLLRSYGQFTAYRLEFMISLSVVDLRVVYVDMAANLMLES
jgi:hypothetical protein